MPVVSCLRLLLGVFDIALRGCKSRMAHLGLQVAVTDAPIVVGRRGGLAHIGNRLSRLALRACEFLRRLMVWLAVIYCRGITLITTKSSEGAIAPTRR